MHHLNIRRGFFRLWFVVSVAWIAGCIALLCSAILRPHVTEKVYVLPSLTPDVYELDLASDRFSAEFQNYVTINFPNNVTLLAPKGDATKKALIDRDFPKTFLEKYSKPRDIEVSLARATALGELGWIAFVPPVVLLVFGWAIGWSLSGFKPDKPSDQNT